MKRKPYNQNIDSFIFLQTRAKFRAVFIFVPSFVLMLVVQYLHVHVYKAACYYGLLHIPCRVQQNTRAYNIFPSLASFFEVDTVLPLFMVASRDFHK